MSTRLTEAQLDLLQSEKGALFVIDDGDLQIVCRKMTRAEWKRFLDATEEGGKSISAIANLFRGTVLSPPLAELDKLFDEDPTLETDVAGQYVRLAKNQRQFEAKKRLAASWRPRATRSRRPSVDAPCTTGATPTTPWWAPFWTSSFSP